MHSMLFSKNHVSIIICQTYKGNLNHLFLKINISLNFIASVQHIVKTFTHLKYRSSCT